MEALAVFSGVLTFLGSVPYVISIVRRRTVPNRVSWWIWSAVGLLLLLTYEDLGGTSGLGIAAAAFVGQIVIAILSIRFGRGGGTAIDGICLAGTGIALIVWYLLSSAVLPHLMILVIDLCAWAPTARKALARPESEDLAAWTLWTMAALIALLQSFSLGGWDTPYPLYLVVTDGIVLSILGMAAMGRKRRA